MGKWSKDFLDKVSPESYQRFIAIQKTPDILNDNEALRSALLDFIADFSNWDNSTVREYLDTSRALTQSAHEALGGAPGTRPLVVDPFAGGGSIPLEALRVGADAFASDLNPIPVLLNKVVLEYIPKYGKHLADDVHRWGELIKKEAEKDLADFYPNDPDGAIPIAYLWARTIQCEGPGCGFTLPLIRTMKLSATQYIYLRDTLEKNCFISEVHDGSKAVQHPTVAGGKATCPRCGYTTSANSVKSQLIKKRGGANDAQILAVYLESTANRMFRSSRDSDLESLRKALKFWEENQDYFPVDQINEIRPYKNTRGLSAVTRIGICRFADLYTVRQAVSIMVFSKCLMNVITDGTAIKNGNNVDQERIIATLTLIGFAVSRLIQQNSSLSRWQNNRSTIAGAFSKQALQITWDFAESNPIGSGSGAWDGALDWITRVIEATNCISNTGSVSHVSAKHCPLPNDSGDALITDPPYFASIPYADLSGFFYVWLRKIFQYLYKDLFTRDEIDQKDEAIVTNSNFGPSGEKKDEYFYTHEMILSLDKAREISKPNSIAVIVFADSSTAAWESILNAVLKSGWVITGSWPIDTELQSRTKARDAASLQSSVHLVCRPRENSDGSIRSDVLGDWRDVLQELPVRIHEWMPRLAEEGVVGADAIFACLGPALEIFSRYSRVEKASGEPVTLREYLEQVWAAVAKEALSLVFKDADATGFEEDARLTAMWLWTINAGNPNGTNGKNGKKNEEEVEPEDDEDEGSAKKTKVTGFMLEYDAARKIAQGLGAHLEDLNHLVEIKGETARLLPVAERTRHLFGKDQADAPSSAKKKKASPQMKLDMFDELTDPETAETAWGEKAISKPGETSLDRVHQCMILFAAGRGEALKRFLVEDGVGRDPRFWALAQALSALYPAHTDEKRWVDGVLARKKGLGF